jgi:hypothetical protein
VQEENFKCYAAKFAFDNPQRFKRQRVFLEDQFGTSNARVVSPFEICNPVDKTREGEETGDGINNPEAHLACYKIYDNTHTVRRNVIDTDQFGPEELTVAASRLLCLPALKNCDPLDDRDCDEELGDLERSLAHQQCYDARTTRDTPAFVPAPVNLADQFETKDTLVKKAIHHCNPVYQKNAQDLTPVPTFPNTDDEIHYKCYSIDDAEGQDPFRGTIVRVQDQFGTKHIQAGRPTRLCEPATKVWID